MASQHAETRPYDESGPYIKDFLARRWKLMAGTALIILLLTGLYLILANSMYTARSVVALDLRRNTINEQAGSVLAAPTPSDELIETEISSITSRTMAARVVNDLDLVSNKNFAGETGGGLKGLLRSFFYDSQPEDTEITAERLVQDQLLRNLDVSRVGESFAIALRYSSGDPEMAARVVNSFADNYLSSQVEQRSGALEDADEQLSERLEELRIRLQGAEGRLAAAQARSGIVNSGSSAAGSSIPLLESQRAAAMADAAVAAGRVSAGAAEAAVNSSPEIQSLRNQLSQIRAQAAAQDARYGPNHPLAKSTDDAERLLDQQIASRSSAILKSVLAEQRVEAQAQAQRAAVGSASLSAARSDYARQIGATGNIATLQTEVDTLRALYDAELNRYNAVTGDMGGGADAQLVARAVTPQIPTSPNVKLTLALGLLLAVLGAMAVGILAELVGYRDGDISRLGADPA